MQPIDGPGLAPLRPGATAPEPDLEAEPEGYVVVSDDATRIHFLDWGGADGPDAPGVLLVPGLATTAWAWAPVARRLRRAARVAVMDLRGHGLSDAPVGGYDPDQVAGDAIAVAEGAGVLDDRRPFVIAGLGYGAVVAAWAANALGGRCRGLVLCDGGWEAMAAVTDATPDEWLAAIEEPPEVLASLDAWLADRRAFDPATWDADQDRAARAQVVETAAGRLKLAVHPHAMAGSVRALFTYDPAAVLPMVEADVVALLARDDDAGGREAALRAAAILRRSAGRPPIAALRLPAVGHNLPRYAPDLVTAALLAAAAAAADPAGAPNPASSEDPTGRSR